MPNFPQPLHMNPAPNNSFNIFSLGERIEINNILNFVSKMEANHLLPLTVHGRKEQEKL